MISASVLLCSNVIVAACAISFRWNVFEVIVLYWIQAFIIGLFQKRKIDDMVAYAHDPARRKWLSDHATPLMREGMGSGFLGIYLLFWAMEGAILLFKYLASGGLTVSPTAVVLASSMFLFTHWWSYRTNKKTDERRVIDINNTVALPLFRMLLPLHVFSVVIDFDEIQSPAVVIVWMLIKTAMDVGIHVKEHGERRTVPA